jgi:hypothetical protein
LKYELYWLQQAVEDLFELRARVALKRYEFS